jgi:hypothetical protein
LECIPQVLFALPLRRSGNDLNVQEGIDICIFLIEIFFWYLMNVERLTDASYRFMLGQLQGLLLVPYGIDYTCNFVSRMTKLQEVATCQGWYVLTR